MSELKPCPFCGHRNPKITKKRSGNYYRKGDYIQILCNKCKARGPIFEAKHDDVRDSRGARIYGRCNPETVTHTEQLAIDAWNRRASGTVINWINVKDALPEKSGEVLVAFASRDGDVFYGIANVEYSSRHKKFNVYDWMDEEDATNMSYTPTHWTPLPKPPKELKL